MAFVHGQSTKVFLGPAKVDGVISSVQVSAERDMAEVTCLSSGGTRFMPGMIGGGLSMSGFFESDQGASGTDYIHELMMNTIDVQSGMLILVAPADLEVGYPAFFGQGNTEGYDVEASTSDAVSISIDATPENGIDWGVLLHDHTAQVASTNGDSVDNGDATSNGAVAILHVTAASGTTPTLDVTIQHSTDGNTWADLITFTQTDDITAEFKSVTGTVNQYVRAISTIAGSDPSFTWVAAIARR